MTEDRLKVVDFVPLPIKGTISEVLVTGPKSPAVGSADELSGKTVHVRKSSSYFESLAALNDRLGKVLPEIKVHEQVVLHEGGRVGWAVRRGSTQLEKVPAEFFAQAVEKQGVVAYRHAMFNRQIRQIKDPTGGEDAKRFQDTITLFNKYAPRYGFDAVPR